MRRLRFVCLAIVVVALLFVGGPGPADATQDTRADRAAAADEGESGDEQSGEFASLKIEVIGGVPWEEGRRVDAAVTVKTERAVSGTLLVIDTPDGRSTTTYEFTIDLAAGSSAALPITLTTGWQGVQATATLRSNGEVIAGDDIERFGEQAGDDGAVGALGIDSPPQRVPELSGDTQLPVLKLDGRLTGIDRVSSLVTTPGAFRSLGAGSAESLLIDAWVQGGGQLVVDGPIRSLDDGYHGAPTANPARFGFGAGSIVYLEDWEDGIPLGGYVGVGALRELVESQNLGAGASGELAILANVALPAVALIAGALLLYSLIAGPVVFGLLSAKRAQRWMWTVLPVLSLVFAAGILTVGFIGRSGRTEAHITIVEVNERGSRATSNLLLNSSFGGNRQIETPTGWTYLGQGRTNGQRPVQLRVGLSSTEISLDMPPGSNAVARLGGVASEFDGALTIGNARLDGDQITAEVSNNGSTDLTNAVALLGNARAEVGLLPAGETVTFSIDAQDSSGRTMKELLIWPRVGRDWGNSGPVAVPQDRNAETAAGAWTEWRIDQGTTASPENVLGIAAWSDDLPGPVPGISEGRTVLFARIDVSDARRAIDFRTTARLPSHQQPIFNGNFSGFVEDYRVTFGPATDLDRLAIGVTTESAALSLWTTEGWRFVELPENGEARFTIPPEAVIDGELLMRSHVPEWIWGAGATALIVIDPEQAASAKLDPEPTFRSAEGGGFGEREPIDRGFGPQGANGVPRGLGQDDLTVFEAVDVDAEHDVAGQVSNGLHDAYMVPLEENQSLVVTMHSDQGDSYLELLNAEGELVASNDDFGRGVDSQIQYRVDGVDGAGVYEIRAMDLSSGSIDYQLSVVVTE